MKRSAKRVVLAALTSVAAAASFTLASAPQALAMNQVPCTQDDFLQIDVHPTAGPTSTRCFANAGFIDYPSGDLWVTRIWTGNNRVQWFGDGRWQPEGGINKWTVFQWPHHPGGVRMNAIRIL
ncbi:beta/gamma crystallin domain-containing protein [Streptomyces sp. CA-181903]|uniref:beta/gamma crystallin domain-containing protein n=1 Tax=Streptomyces sp. CA-181903 TaxID=3240055 RepID=UPI003D91CB0F